MGEILHCKNLKIYCNNAPIYNTPTTATKLCQTLLTLSNISLSPCKRASAFSFVQKLQTIAIPSQQIVTGTKNYRNTFPADRHRLRKVHRFCYALKHISHPIHNVKYIARYSVNTASPFITSQTKQQQKKRSKRSKKQRTPLPVAVIRATSFSVSGGTVLQSKTIFRCPCLIVCLARAWLILLSRQTYPRTHTHTARTGISSLYLDCGPLPSQ